MEKQKKDRNQRRKDARKRVKEAGQALKCSCSLAAGGACQVRGAPKNGPRAERSQAHEHARSAALREGLGQGLSPRFVASWVRWKRRCLGTPKAAQRSGCDGTLYFTSEPQRRKQPAPTLHPGYA